MNFEDSLGKHKRMIAIGIVIIIIVAVIGFTLSRLVFDSDEELEAILQVDKTIARVGETINLSAEDCNGKITSFNWDFGDGNTSSEINPKHQYERAGWYNVTLIINNDKGKESNVTEKIGIQYNDIFVERDTLREYSTLRNPWGYGIGADAEIGHNIKKPSAVIHGEIQKGIGSFYFRVSVMFWNPERTGASGEGLYSESIRAIRNTIQFDYIIQADEIPDEVYSENAFISASVVVDDGTWESASISMDVTFPID